MSLPTATSAPPGYDQQMAYVPLRGGTILAIGLNEGQVQWTLELPTTSTPATGDGMVFVAGDTSVTAVDQQTGGTMWQTPLEVPIVGPVYWDAGWLLVSTETYLLALDGDDGRVLWRTALGSPLAAPPTSSGDRVYVGLLDGRVVALDQETGREVWVLNLHEQVTGALALEEQLVVGTRANLLHSISLDRGRIRWSQKAGADVMGSPAADADNIYFVAFDNVLRALNRRNGHLRWSRNLPSRPAGGPLRVDNVVLVALRTNDIGAYLASSGAPSFTITAVGELGDAPFLRDNVRPTAPRLIAISREGAIQGFASRIEPPPAPLGELPGARVGGE